ncbi:MAG TPA: hypothetical protein VEA99_12650, partial [Gemmatimonadaceae bacterium]|nr:hypothetical protein [Gemmatimonadaceae bacterium]
VLDALVRMKALAIQMAESLGAGDLDALGELVGEHWRYQRSLHPAITTPLIEELVERAGRAGALGCKPLGASGGGCLLVVARAGRESEVRNALSPLGELLSYEVDDEGFTVIHDGPVAELPDAVRHAGDGR